MVGFLGGLNFDIYDIAIITEVLEKGYSPLRSTEIISSILKKNAFFIEIYYLPLLT